VFVLSPRGQTGFLTPETGFVERESKLLAAATIFRYTF
jgi:hypothetical protein